MSTRGTTFWDDPSDYDWVPEKRPCPFCEVPSHVCGCPTGESMQLERIDEIHLIRGTE